MVKDPGGRASRSRARGNREARFLDNVERFLDAKAAGKKAENTLAAYRRDLHGVGDRIAGGAGLALEQLMLDDLTLDMLEAGMASWARDHATASVARAWSTWNSFFDHLVARRLVAGNPMGAVARARPPSPVPRRIDAVDAVERLLSAANAPARSPTSPRWPARDVALVATFLFTGIRLAEAQALTVGSLDSDHQGAWRLRVRGKGSKERVLPLSPEVKGLIDRYLAARAARFPDHDLTASATALFVHVNGGPLNRNHITYLVRRLYAHAGLQSKVPPGTLVHALRHTFGIRLVDVGTPVTVVQELLGHRSLNTTQRYLKATALELRDAVAGHPDRSALQAALRDDAED